MRSDNLQNDDPLRRAAPAAQAHSESVGPEPTVPPIAATVVPPAIHHKASPDAPVLRLTREVFAAIRDTVGQARAETGGVFGTADDETIHCFAFDATGRRGTASYSPDVRRMNGLFRDRWNPVGVRLAGFVHSHPPGARRPSEGDRRYAERILGALPHLDRLYLPIVMSGHDGVRFELLPFVAERDERGGASIHACRLEIAAPTNANAPSAQATPARNRVPATRRQRRMLADPAFARVRGAYDMERLVRSRVICIGCGGSAGFIEDLARAGIGQFVLVDPDRVERKNIATQAVFRADVGRPKVAALADRIRRVNSRTHIVRRREKAEAITPAEWQWLAFGRHLTTSAPPEAVLVLGLTDNFNAQAYVNRLALALRLPSLCAQVYAEGRGAEITFTHPGRTGACHRCMLKSRYDAYARGYSNRVGTERAPIFATTRLNALKGYLALALLHQGTGHSRWEGLLERAGARSLIQLRLDPDIASSLRLGVFDRVFAGADQDCLMFDEAVWLPQAVEPNCPDCGGLGPDALVPFPVCEMQTEAGRFGIFVSKAKTALERNLVRLRSRLKRGNGRQ